MKVANPRKVIRLQNGNSQAQPQDLVETTIGEVPLNLGPLTVIIPTYNSENFIEHQIRNLWSVLDDAGIAVDEYLIIDDCSSDRTRSVLQEMMADEPRLRVATHSVPRGLQLAVTTGIDVACNETILICEDDFLYDVPTIRKIVGPVLADEVDACIGSSIVGQRKFSSRLFWTGLRFLSSGRIAEREIMLRCIGPKMVSEIRTYRDVVRTITGLMMEIGLRTRRIAVSGISTGIRESGQRTRHRLHLAVDVYLTLAQRPFFSLLYAGLCSALLSFCLIVTFVVEFMRHGFSPESLLFAALTAVFGIVSVTLTLFWAVTQMLGLVIREVRRRPLTSYWVESPELS